MENPHMVKRKWGLPLVAVVLLAGLSGCVVMDDADWKEDGYEARAAFDRVFILGQKNRLKLEAVNGPVTVVGQAAATQVRVWGERVVVSDDPADAEEHLGDLSVRFVESGSQIEVTTEQPSQSDGRTYQVDYFVALPAHWSVDLELVNGVLRVDSLSGTVRIDLVNGQVDASGLRGNLGVTMTNGQFEGDVALPDQGQCSIQTVNGTIDLDIPAATSASFTAGVVNGGISVTGLPLDGFTVSNWLVNGVLGSGDGKISLGGVNGRIAVTGR